MTSLQNKLSSLFREMNNFLSDKKLISRLELYLKIRELISSFMFSDTEKKECETLYEYPLEQFLFLSVTTGIPSSFQVPVFDEKLMYKETLLYYPHTFTPSNDILEKTYERVCQLQLERLKQIITKKLIQIEYNINEISSDYIRASRAPLELNCHLFCSIVKLIEMIKYLELTQNDALIIPPGTTIKPFLEFYQQYSNRLLLKGTSVWLVDTETETMNTFIGIPKDKKLLAFFTKSELATQIERLWRPTISEDF